MNQFRPRSALVPTPTPDRLQAGSIPPPTNYQRNIEHGVRGRSALTRPHTVMGNRDVNVLNRNTGADSGAPSSHHDVASMCLNPMDERLSGVRQGIANLSLTLQCDMDAKRQYEETRMYELRQITEKMERHLALEVKRRTESDRALQALVEHKIQDAVENMNVAVTHKFQMLQQDIDILTRKLEQTCNELAVEREKNQRLTQELRQQYAEGFEGIQKIFERERAQRLEKEATLLRRLSEDVRCLAERVDVEHYARETGLRQLKEYVTEGWSKQNSQVDSEKFRLRILEELQCLRNALRLETEAREKSEVSLAATMQELVVQVQEGLRFASS